MDTQDEMILFLTFAVYLATAIVFICWLLVKLPRAWRIVVLLRNGYTWKLARIMSRRRAYEGSYQQRVEELEQRIKQLSWKSKHKVK